MIEGRDPKTGRLRCPDLGCLFSLGTLCPDAPDFHGATHRFGPDAGNSGARSTWRDLMPKDCTCDIRGFLEIGEAMRAV
jgi:hypothetical protein